MSEHEPHMNNHEHEPISPENAVEAPVEAKKGPEVSQEHLEHLEKQKHAMHEKAEAIINEEAEPAKEVVIDQAESGPKQDNYTGREARDHTYRHNLQRVRRQLSAPNKVLSKLVHNPIVDQISEVGGRTVARPSGLLGGGFFALLSTSILVFYAKHNGLTYNYGIFLVFFVGGYIIGMTLEFLWNMTKGSKIK